MQDNNDNQRPPGPADEGGATGPPDAGRPADGQGGAEDPARGEAQPPYWPGAEAAPGPPMYPGPYAGAGAPGSSIPGFQQPSGKSRRGPLLTIVAILAVSVVLLVIMTMVLGGGGGAGSVGFGEKIGVVKVEGVIFEAKPVIEQIHRCRDDDSIRAVVIRVDSPGGAVGPSQEIHDEVLKLAETKKVVVSMGSVAASGGYYISCPADVIFANPGTITGSIGVVMEMTNLEGLFEWAKIENNVIKSGKYKDIGSPYREMTGEERQLLQDFVDNVHAQFESAVASGRKMDPEKVSEIANGTIYSGEQALDIGLVDELGNLYDAIDKAAELAGIEGEPRVVWPPEPDPNIFQLFNSKLNGIGGINGTLSSPVRVMYILNVN